MRYLQNIAGSRLDGFTLRMSDSEPSLSPSRVLDDPSTETTGTAGALDEGGSDTPQERSGSLSTGRTGNVK